MTQEALVTCRYVTRLYPSLGESAVALNKVSVDFMPGRMSSLVGPSGSGKSTLLRIIAGLDRATEGEVLVVGRELSSLSDRERRRLRRTTVAFLYQRASDNLISYLSVREHLQLSRSQDMDSSDDALEALEMEALVDRKPHELSGGEQQRLALAQAIVSGYPILLADEPTAELDAHAAQLVIRLLRHAADTGVAVVVATHDPLVAGASDHVLSLRDGSLAG